MAWVFNPFTGTFDWTAAGGGGGGSPGGVSGQLQYNNGGSFGGALLTYAAGSLQLGAADVSSGAVAQTLQVQSNTGAATTGPNFTIKGSAGTTAGGSIIFQTAATTSYATALTINSAKQLVIGAGSTSANTIVFDSASPHEIGLYSRSSGAWTWYSKIAGNMAEMIAVSGDMFFQLNATAGFGWGSGAAGTGSDVILRRDGQPNTLALRNGAFAQTFNVYASYTSASDYARTYISTGQIGYQSAGTGSAASFEIINPTAGIYFQTGTGGTATRRWTIDSSGMLLAVANNQYDIGASGANSPRNVYVAGRVFGGSITAGTSSVLGIDQRIQMTSGSDGIMAIYNWGTTDFGRLQFGGTTSSFPALKRKSSSATLQVRVADDTAFSNIEAAQFIAPPTALTSGATITWNSNTSSVATLTLDQVGATLTVSNAVAGGTYVLIVTQGTGGNKTITTWTNFKWQGGAAPTLSATAGAIDVITAVYDGTNFLAAAQLGFA